MDAPRHAVCFHGHFYQPPREHPWLGVVEAEASAAPDRDWNTRITRECYAPHAAARILDRAARLAAVMNCYEWTSFDFGPTLLTWLEPHAPEVMSALRRADAAAHRRTGFGNAWAQAYGHAILPLSTPRDVRTQVLWGRRDFERRFGRPPDGMWLPEMAVDQTSLVALAEAGIGLTLLAPHQARRVRRLGDDDAGWQAVTAEILDVRRLYRCILPGGLSIDVLFRDERTSRDVAFGPLLGDGATLADRVFAAVREASGPSIFAVAVDGETYGHHHRFGEMALAFALRSLAADPDVALVGPAAFRAAHPPMHEVEIVEGTSWSCEHGVERWRSDCGCRVGGSGGSQAWRAPLRAAIDWLRDEVAVLYETRAGEVLRDPWGARDRYIDCVLDPARMSSFLAAEASGRMSPAEAVLSRRALEMSRHALAMQTSCGWFFDELTGLEPLIVLRHAARTIELAQTLGRRLEDGFMSRLEPAHSNVPGQGSGADVYRRAAVAAATPARVAATGALLALLDQPTRLPGYDLNLPAGPAGDRLVGETRVTELSTGATATVPVMAERPPGGAPWCRTGERSFTLADLFGIQQERLFDIIGRKAAADTRAGRRAALAEVRPVLDPLMASDTPLPLPLALLLGYEEAETMASALGARAAPLRALVAHAAALRQRGVILPARALAGQIERALEERLGLLPDGAEDALSLLDLASAAGLTLDLAAAQIRALTWWTTARRPEPVDERLRQLAERLNLALVS